jgi:hypothetical protein
MRGSDKSLCLCSNRDGPFPRLPAADRQRRVLRQPARCDRCAALKRHALFRVRNEAGLSTDVWEKTSVRYSRPQATGIDHCRALVCDAGGNTSPQEYDVLTTRAYEPASTRLSSFICALSDGFQTVRPRGRLEAAAHVIMSRALSYFQHVLREPNDFLRLAG